MQKRKPFLVKENFQLKFTAGFTAILTAGIFFAAVLIYNRLNEILERAAFSSHLSLESSGELFWRTIFEINLFAAGAGLLLAFTVVVGAHFYLERFFGSLADGLEKIAQGDFSFRLKRKGSRWVGGLVDEFNLSVFRLEEDAEKIKDLLGNSLKILSSREKSTATQLKIMAEKLRKVKTV